MKLYTTNVYLSHKGKIIEPGEDIKLTDSQAKRLNDSVVLKVNDVVTEALEEVEAGEVYYEDFTVSELKELASSLNMTNYSKLNKGELIKLLKEAD